MIRIGSLFSGIGGLELGIESALIAHGMNAHTAWQVEKDEFCNRILMRHWPDALRHTDVCSVGAHNLTPVDVLCGGFPCQDVSYAGKGAGLAGARSGLWYEFSRIVREIRPRIVVVENVAALASRGLDAVLGSLAEGGYDAVWFPLRASDVGAPHQRERLFIVGCRMDDAESDGWDRSSREGNARYVGEAREGMRSARGQQATVARDASSREPERAGDENVVNSRRRAAQPEREPGIVRGAKGGARGEARQQRRGDSPDGAGEDAGGSRGQRRPAGAHGGRRPQPVLGGKPHGLPRELDLSSVTEHRWPARPGEAQHEWEAPRVTTQKEHRNVRLRALGNAVVPQCGYVIGCVVAEMLVHVQGHAS